MGFYNPSDPRFRRALNAVNSNVETATQSVQVGLFSITEHCLKPCFLSFSTCVTDSVNGCFPPRRDDAHNRRAHRRPGGRPELSFDFYDDWEDDEHDALLAWGNDEYDQLLGADEQPQPRRANIMSYGTARAADPRPRKTAVLPYDGRPDPTVIPNQSYFGFMNNLPFKFGGRGRRYKPSAASMQVQSKGAKDGNEQSGPSREGGLVDAPGGGGQRRQRSATVGSGHTTDSYSSRGDIFPSDDEDDAQPLDDEFATALERRTSAKDDGSSGKTRSSKARKEKRLSGSRRPTRTPSSRSSRSSGERSIPSQEQPGAEVAEAQPQSLADLKKEEQRVQALEEREVEIKREAAQKLARERGLSVGDGSEGSDAHQEAQEDTADPSLEAIASDERAASPAAEEEEPALKPHEVP